MNITQYFKLAVKSLRTSKMRAFLTMLGIIIGVGAVIIIISLGNGLQKMVDQQVESMGVNLIQTYVYGRGDGTTMLLDPDLIVMDEPTSSLDILREKELLYTLQKACSDKMLLLVSHRPSTLTGCTRLIRLEHGKAVPV